MVRLLKVSNIGCYYPIHRFKIDNNFYDKATLTVAFLCLSAHGCAVLSVYNDLNVRFIKGEAMTEKSLVINPFDLLTDQQKKLVTSFLESGDKTKAKKDAGLQYSGKDPFRAVNVRRAINHAMRPAFDKAGITFEKHIEYVANIAYGDPSEIAEIVVVNCRYCHGVDHRYQFTEQQYDKMVRDEIKEFKKNMKLAPNTPYQELLDRGFVEPLIEGGTGFDQWREPDAMCPECGGEGERRIQIHPSAVNHPLFAGVSYDKNGNLIVKFRNQDAALEHLSKLMGFLVDKTEVTIVDHASKLTAAQRAPISRQ